ncbi:hypothetical protein BCR34DRAFT_583550 [Clohesyomyces aquaticus]|uniref:Uncharacterized protein n=1 Tax=Clohesyomyces aquaticus TaxID=1231657 RepID=A0A1Y2A5A7_9PLEO|nr:hypothetical protein BCR34DRAFT_583550 [Clohesyomyces aquaticus]
MKVTNETLQYNYCNANNGAFMAEADLTPSPHLLTPTNAPVACLVKTEHQSWATLFPLLNQHANRRLILMGNSPAPSATPPSSGQVASQTGIQTSSQLAVQSSTQASAPSSSSTSTETTTPSSSSTLSGGAIGGIAVGVSTASAEKEGYKPPTRTRRCVWTRYQGAYHIRSCSASRDGSGYRYS